MEEATSARIQAETLRDDYERQCREHEVEIEHLRSRLDQSEADLERLRSVNERTEERLRGELHEARAESRDVSSKRSQELNEAVEALQLRLAQAEAAKQPAVEELEKARVKLKPAMFGADQRRVAPRAGRRRRRCRRRRGRRCCRRCRR